MEKKMKKKISKNAIIIKKLREIKGLNRKEAGLLLEINHKTIESFENGRNPLTEKKIAKYIALYGFTKEDFDLCLKGHITQVKNKYNTPQIKVLENNSLRRSYKKLISKEVKTLKVLRLLKKITQYQASAFCGFDKSAIGHIENGRIELTPTKIEHIINSYGFTSAEFNYHLNSERFITDIQDECVSIIKSLNEEKLKVVYPLLSTFKN